MFCHFPIWCSGSVLVLDLSILDFCLLTYYVHCAISTKINNQAMETVHIKTGASTGVNWKNV